MVNLVCYAVHQNNFTSSIFSSFHGQLSNFVEQHYDPEERLKLGCGSTRDKKLLLFMSYCQQSVLNNFKAKQIFLQGMMENLRDLIFDNKFFKGEDDTVRFVNKLCHWMYAEVNLDDELWDNCKKEMHGVIEEFTYEYKAERGLQEVIDLVIKLYKCNPKFELQAIKQPSAVFDRHRDGHLAYRVFTHSSGTHYIYSGTVIKEESKREPSIKKLVREQRIISEFNLFLNNLPAQNQSYLYVNLRGRSDECPLLRQLSCYVIKLDKTSAKYFEMGSIRRPNEMEKFKYALFEDMLDPDNPYVYWDQKIDRSALEGWCSGVIHAIAEKHFEGVTILNEDQKKAFYELFNVRIVQKINKKLNITYCGIACAQIADRAPTLIAGIYADDRFKQKSILSEQEVQKFVTTVFSPALTNYNRVPTELYTDRLKLIMPYLSSQ